MSPSITLTTGEQEEYDVVYRAPNSKCVAGVNKGREFTVDVYVGQNVLRIDSSNAHRTEQPRSIQYYDDENPLTAEDMLNVHDYVLF